MLRVSGERLGFWAGAVGLGEIASRTPMRASDRFRAGSIMKPFVAAAVLQLAEDGTLSLDSALPDVLPEHTHGRFQDAHSITVRRLLNHTAGLPEWLGPPIRAQLMANPRRVWGVAEFLEISGAQERVLPPGARYAYSNTHYNLLGAIIEHATGVTWRDAVRERVIARAGLGETSLPEPGDAWIPGEHAHGYEGAIDVTYVDPSMAGAAGGGALITTLADLARFWDALLAGDLLRRGETLREMLAFVDAPDVGGQVGYGLGVQRYVLPGGLEVIGHLGSTAGYRAFGGRVRRLGVTVAMAMNTPADPAPVLLPALDAMRRNLRP